ncbi:MAG: HTH-type transcriptional regulator BhcR [Sedimentitalea sp.]
MKPASRSRGRPKGFNNNPSQTVIQSLDRALDVLDALASGRDMTLSEISTQLSQSPATMHRVLTTLALRDVVEVDQANQTWNIGPAAFRLGSAFLRRTNVVERSQPAMRQLMEATGETSNLGIERSGMVVFVNQVETHDSIRAFFPPGTISPMHASGIGKALLASYEPDRARQILDQNPPEPFTTRTITDPESMATELERIRNLGYAFDNEEKTLGMRCIASPIVNYQGQAVAGISISGPSHRVELGRVATLGALVREAARSVSRGLGAELPDSPSTTGR